jgi:hypothetical protein
MLVADAESFLADMLSIFPLLGLTVFEKAIGIKSSFKHLFMIVAKGISAKGYETSDGFIVLQGSTAVCSEVLSIHRYQYDLRKDLQSQGVMVSRGDLYNLPVPFIRYYQSGKMHSLLCARDGTPAPVYW